MGHSQKRQKPSQQSKTQKLTGFRLTKLAGSGLLKESLKQSSRSQAVAPAGRVYRSASKRSKTITTVKNSEISVIAQRWQEPQDKVPSSEYTSYGSSRTVSFLLFFSLCHGACPCSPCACSPGSCACSPSPCTCSPNICPCSPSLCTCSPSSCPRRQRSVHHYAGLGSKCTATLVVTK